MSFNEFWAQYSNTNEFMQDEWEVCTRFELSNITIEMIEADNATHGFMRCYPVDADCCK